MTLLEAELLARSVREMANKSLNFIRAVVKNSPAIREKDAATHDFHLRGFHVDRDNNLFGMIYSADRSGYAAYKIGMIETKTEDD